MPATDPVDIVILTNGPGEVATWVKPVVQALADKLSGHRLQPSEGQTSEGPVFDAQVPVRISVILSPCPHASGQEHITLSQYPEVDRVQSADHFFKFLLTGKTADGWDWHPQGVVVFLGGDQLYTVLVAKRIEQKIGCRYRTVTYAEWDARWPSLIDRFGVMNPNLVQAAPVKHQDKFAVVGDLMADVQVSANRQTIATKLGCDPAHEIIGFLPGSKPMKLKMGVPIMLAIAQILHRQGSKYTYVIGVAPNLTLADIIHYTDPVQNSAIALFNAPTAELITPAGSLSYLQLKDGPKILLWQQFPALDLFSQCALCFTTVGANTAQLGALATPMIVLLPTQQLDSLSIADGLPGLIAQLPGVGQLARKVINPLIVKALQKSGRRFAWPNIWAKQEVVPELFGAITPASVSAIALNYLTHPEKLTAIRQTLRTLRGPAGAANKMANLILETIDYPK
ncbi:MAG: lipid-A-disaccharide synthase [Cyanobacteria bacterium P01_D01_bin.105]